jgi:hypothetical protein
MEQPCGAWEWHPWEISHSVLSPHETLRCPKDMQRRELHPLVKDREQKQICEKHALVIRFKCIPTQRTFENTGSISTCGGASWWRSILSTSRLLSVIRICGSQAKPGHTRHRAVWLWDLWISSVEEALLWTGSPLLTSRNTEQVLRVGTHAVRVLGVLPLPQVTLGNVVITCSHCLKSVTCAVKSVFLTAQPPSSPKVGIHCFNKYLLLYAGY